MDFSTQKFFCTYLKLFIHSCTECLSRTIIKVWVTRARGSTLGRNLFLQQIYSFPPPSFTQSSTCCLHYCLNCLELSCNSSTIWKGFKDVPQLSSFNRFSIHRRLLIWFIRSCYNDIDAASPPWLLCNTLYLWMLQLVFRLFILPNRNWVLMQKFSGGLLILLLVSSSMMVYNRYFNVLCPCFPFSGSSLQGSNFDVNCESIFQYRSIQ